MKNREHLVTYLLRVEAKALTEALQLGDPEPAHFALSAVLDELESLQLVRVPHPQ